MTRDALSNPVTGASAAGLDAYGTALHQLQCYIGDPVATIDGALAESPGFVMGHVMRAWLHLLGTEPAGIAIARDSRAAALALTANERERGHLVAIGHLVDGHWHAAGAVMEDVAIAWPRDALALQAGHLIDFYSGNPRMLRDRVARTLPAWSAGMPGFPAVLGMHAFGLEETGDYVRAEMTGRAALALEPRDTWSWHAVAHVMEMQGRQREGMAWYRSNTPAWADDSFFAVHNWWHLALFHLDVGETEAALALYDGPVNGGRSEVMLDLIDASALLWRLQLRGVSIGDRWHTLADLWEPVAFAGTYAFNDVHAMMAFAASGRTDAMGRILEAQREAMARPDDNAAFTREVGHPIAMAIRAFADEDYAGCVRLLRAVRAIAHRFGGSHAQRDVLDLTLIEAALRAGDKALAAALAAERLAVKPTSPLNRLLAQRAGPLPQAA